MRTGLLTLLLSLATVLHAQPDVQKAQIYYQKAIEQRQTGAVAEAIRLFSLAAESDTANFRYPYEYGYTLALAGLYPEALVEMKKAAAKTGASDTCFQMLGSLYVKTEDTAAARKALERGLQLHPNSGRLFCEMGLLRMKEEKFVRAAALFDKGIAAEPMYSMNYYYGAKLALAAGEKHWGLIYCELFLLTDKESDLRGEVRQLMYDTYAESISADPNGYTVLHFCTSAKSQSSFCAAFNKCMTAAVPSGTKQVDLAAMAQIRTKFILKFFGDKFDKTFPNALFDHLKKMQDAGVLNAYHYWLLNVGEKQSFLSWYDRSENQEQFQQMMTWMSKNPLQLDAANAVVRRP